MWQRPDRRSRKRIERAARLIRKHEQRLAREIETPPKPHPWHDAVAAAVQIAVGALIALGWIAVVLRAAHNGGL